MRSSRRSRRLLGLLVTLILADRPRVSAQASQTQSDSVSSRTARELVTAALDALGGTDRARALGSIVIHGKGSEYRGAQMQGVDPDRELATPREEWLTIDVANERAAIEYHAPRHDGSDRWRRFAYAKDQRTVVDFIGRFAGHSTYPAADRVRRELTRRVPHLLLLEALGAEGVLRDRGDAVLAEKPVHLVAYAVSGLRSDLTLAFEPSTKRLAAVLYRIDYPGLGDTEVRLTFAPYQPHPSLQLFPSGHTLSLNGRVFQQINYQTVAVDSPGSADRFAIPDEIASQMASPSSITEAAPGVYVANGFAGFTTMFVEFRDFIVALEAPAAGYAEFDQIPVTGLPPVDSVSTALIAAIKQRVPRKPIRYVAVSHFHNDHAGGVRSFWAAGATLLTTPGAERYFQSLARKGFRGEDDMCGAGARPARIESIDRRRIITDGERTLELINVGFTPHTDEALVGYLPQGRILYQGDQFYFQGDDTFPPRERLGVMQHFARWLVGSGLAVDRIYGTHMSGYATMRHVREVLARPAATGVRRPSARTAPKPKGS